ncbi:OLC1v1038924C3 [Oldenlandia corymbosa var. corymbosa]|uniref:OLC1v1038924C3 n=1 Tax=Oldenlandia corymbosa var. corymbosa TaxID=529605 RepID=A0AAV1D4L9_OLDCO|nr:OLC1v1038924C3 [Oldenlandia corymbosa var. corymbosa]
MKRKRGYAKRKPLKKPQIAEDHSQCDGNDGVDFRVEAETAHAAANMHRLHTAREEEGSLGNLDAGDSIPTSNIFKNVANFAAKLSRTVGSSNVELTNKSLPVHGDKILGRERGVCHLDPVNNEQELNAALSVILNVMKMDAAKPFNIPVNPVALGIPDYLDVIDTPMDFGTICNNLEWGGKYRNSKEVFKDVQLIFDNCSKYHKEGDYILDLMQRVSSNFMKQWNAAGLFSPGEEVDHGKNLQDATECCTRKNNDRNVFQSGAKISNSILQEKQDFTSLCQMQQHETPCISLTQSKFLHPQNQGERQFSEFQSFHPQCSGHLATAGHNVHAHYHQGGRSSGINRQLQDESRPQKEISHQLSTSCGSKYHLNDRPSQYQRRSVHHHYSTKPTAPNTESAGHFHLPYQGVSSSPACENCEDACTSVPRVSSVNNHNNYETCSCHYHEHQSLSRCRHQYQPPTRSCDHPSNLREMLNTELDARENVEKGNPHWHSPMEPAVRHTRSRFAYPTASPTGHTIHQQQFQNVQREVQQSTMLHSHSNRLQEQGQFDVGLPETHQPQNMENTNHAEQPYVPAPAESTARPANFRPVHSGSPSTVNSSDQEECPVGPNESQSPSLEHPNQPIEHENPRQATAAIPSSSVPQGESCEAHIADSTRVLKKTRGRGPTRCLKFLNKGKPIPITTNELGQPVGVDAPKLISFLGTLARNGHMAPLTFVDWRAMPEEKKENMWQEVQARFEIDPNSKRWVTKSLSKKWKDWKSKLKTAHYITHATDEERLADRDERVLPDQWAYLVSHWSSELAEKRSARNKANRAKQKFGHITGTKSFARIREEQRANRPDGKAPSRAELFILTRTRKDGNPVNEASSAVITQLREIANQQNDTGQNSGSGDDVFSQVIGRDPRGRIRCEGLAPSSSEFGGGGPSKAEAMKMVAEANSEVCQMKERLVAMEQTCAQMAQQMATMMSMMASMQKTSKDDNVPSQVNDGSGTGGCSSEQQVQSTSLRRSSRLGNI